MGLKKDAGRLAIFLEDKVASWANCRAAIKEDALDQLLTDSSATLRRRKRTIQTGGVPSGWCPRQATPYICARSDLQFRTGD
jgi:hypothetical protein